VKLLLTGGGEFQLKNCWQILVNYSAGISRVFTIFAAARIFLVFFGCKLDVKKKKKIPRFFPPPPYFFHQLKHRLDLLEPSPGRAAAGEQPFPAPAALCSGSPTSPGPVCPEPTRKPDLWHHQGGGSPLPRAPRPRRGAAALPARGSRGANAGEVSRAACGWKRRELLQTPKFHS